MLKTGALPLKNQVSRDSSVDPPESSRSANEINLTGKDGEGISAPTDAERTATVENLERIYFGEDHTERLARRTYRARSGGCANTDEEEDGDDGEKRGITKVAQDQSIGQDLEDVMRMMKMEMLRKLMGSIPREGVGLILPIVTTMMEQEMKRTGTMNALNQSITLAIHRMMIKAKDHKQYRKKHCSHHSSRMRRRSSKKQSNEENESDSDGRDHRHSRKKHCSQHSSGHGRDKHRHRNRHSSGDKKSRHHLKLDSSSDDKDQNHSNLDKNEKEINDERDELEEGEISSKVSEGFSGIASGHVSRESSVAALISHERATSQSPGTTSEVPDDSRAKIRAMLMATRL